MTTFPKTCSCCQTEITGAEWDLLPFVGEQRTSDETGEYLTVLRNCNGTRADGSPCGTTLAVEHLIRPVGATACETCGGHCTMAATPPPVPAWAGPVCDPPWTEADEDAWREANLSPPDRSDE